jgi:N-acetylglutamate synthase-like GNAT family acetyltransferase
VRIRPATQADQPTIRRLVKEANINPMNLHWPNFVVADDEGAIVGLGQVKTHGDGSRELASIAVVPRRQREGIASSIITTLLAHETGDDLYLTCQPNLERYYERFDFHRIERAEYPPYFRRLLPIFNFVGRWFGTRILVMRRDPARVTPP